MSNKRDPKNPYVNGMTVAEIARAEEKYFYLQVGMEVPIISSGKYTFNQKTAENIFWQMRESLDMMKAEGDEKEQTDAHFCLLNLRMHKLRIH